MAKYKKRADGRYATRVSTGRYDSSGKQIVKTLYGRTIAELDSKVESMRTDLRRGSYADDLGRTFIEYAEIWLSRKEHSTELATYKKYRATVRTLLSPLHPLRLRSIERPDILSVIDSQDGHPDNQRMIVLVVKAILEDAVEDGLIYRNPASRIRQKTHAAAEKRPLFDYEKAALDSIAWPPMELALITILRYFGLRSSEALGLMRSDIDFAADCIHVRRAITFAGAVAQIKDTKSAAGRRDVDAPAGVLDTLADYVKACPSVYLFHGRDGSLMSHSSFRRMWASIYQKICAATGGREQLEPVKLTPHIFRHSYATDLYYAGVDIKEAQRLLGHSSVKMTLELYTHLTPRSGTKEKLSDLTRRAI